MFLIDELDVGMGQVKVQLLKDENIAFCANCRRVVRLNGKNMMKLLDAARQQNKTCLALLERLNC